MQLCCIRLRDLRYLRENIHISVLKLLHKEPLCLSQISQIIADKTQNNNIPNCLSLRNNAACCITLRDLRYLRENIHMRVLNLHCTQKPHVSPADLADYRRQTPKTTITTTCLSLRNNAACCITLRHLRENRPFTLIH